MKERPLKFLKGHCGTCIHKFRRKCVKIVENGDYVAIKDLTVRQVETKCVYKHSKFVMLNLRLRQLLNRLEGQSEKERTQIH